MIDKEEEFLNAPEAEKPAEATEKPGKIDPLREFLGLLKAPRAPSQELVKSTDGDPVGVAARKYFKAFKDAGISGAKDGGGIAFSRAVKEASGEFDAVGLMRKIREETK